MTGRTAALAVVLALVACSDRGADPAATAPLPSPWPPVVGERYPDLDLVGPDGKTVRLSGFEGEVLLVKLIGMNCPGCNAFAGANRADVGRFEGIVPQGGLESIEEYLPRYAGIEIDHPDLVLVQVLLFDLQMRAPGAGDAKRWAEHFDAGRPGRRVVLAGDARFHAAAHRQATYDLIPGFHLVDRSFVLAADSAGHQPRQNLYTELLPALGRLVRGE